MYRTKKKYIYIYITPLYSINGLRYSVLWIQNDLFRIRIQLRIFQISYPDPGKSSRSMRIRIQPTLFKYRIFGKLLTKPP